MHKLNYKTYMNRTFVRFFYYHLTQLWNLKIILKNFLAESPQFALFKALSLYWNSAIDINRLCQNRTDLSCCLVSPPEYE